MRPLIEGAADIGRRLRLSVSPIGIAESSAAIRTTDKAPLKWEQTNS